MVMKCSFVAKADREKEMLENMKKGVTGQSCEKKCFLKKIKC